VAGGVTAALLAERGWRVLLIERQRWPRDKACGGCLNAAGVRLLRTIGLGAIVSGNNAYPLNHFEVHHGKRRLRLDMPGQQGATGGGIAVGRREFDASLVELAQRRGATFLPETSAFLMTQGNRKPPVPPFRKLRLKRDEEETEIRARVVITCDGVDGSCLKNEAWAHWIAAEDSWIGISATLLSGRGIERFIEEGTIGMFVAKGGEGYVGVVRQGPGRVHVGAAVSPKACNKAQGAARVLAEILGDHGVNFARIEGVTFDGTRPLTGKREAVAGYRVLVVGDSCGYVEPFTGEGMSWAIRGAIGVTSVLPGAPPADNWNIEWEEAWSRLHAKEIVSRQAWCNRIREIVRRPWIAGACIGVASWVPFLARRVVRKIST
jgi:2-polyprenyl-6-methoxyphenol hydroxylase-like FAD-dependent oxidoreductase